MEMVLVGLLLVGTAMLLAAIALLLIIAVRSMGGASRGRGARASRASTSNTISDEDELTLVTLGPGAPQAPPPPPIEEPSSASPGSVTRAVPIYTDPDAEIDEPTYTVPVILTSAVARTDRGLRRKKNEDSYLVVEPEGLYVVADGMGGYAGGEVASRTAVESIEEAFRLDHFDQPAYPNVPRRASELAQAVQMANLAIHNHAKLVPALQGMGTTLVAARFAPGKGRVYVGHVGDSRCYRLRGGQLVQLTTDHTLASTGVQGPQAEWLYQAVGVDPVLKIDMVIGKPRIGDVYLLCSDGLTKMSTVEAIRQVLVTRNEPAEAAQELIQLAINGGGKDNITVVVVRVETPGDKDARSAEA
jgi:protein phosphatase